MHPSASPISKDVEKDDNAAGEEQLPLMMTGDAQHMSQP